MSNYHYIKLRLPTLVRCSCGSEFKDEDDFLEHAHAANEERLASQQAKRRRDKR